MNKQEILTIATDYMQDSAGYSDDEVSCAKEKALDYYFQRLRGDEGAGRSAVVSGDLSSMVEANLAQMMSSFTSDRVAEFQADSAEDEDQAQLETDIITDCLMDDNNGFIVLENAIKDALLNRNGIIKVYPKDYSDVTYRELDNVTPEAYAGLALDTDANTEVMEWNQATGYLKTRTTIKTKRLCVENVERFIYKKNWTSLDLEGIPHCGEVHIESRSDMVKRGFDKKAVYEATELGVSSMVDSARNPGKSYEMATHNKDASADQIEWVEMYAMIDKDGDGVAELRHISFIPDQVVLEDVEAPLNPYAAGAVLLNCHRFLGVSLYDKLKQVQDVSTGLQRGLLDNVKLMNTSRFAYVENRVNQDDLDSEVLTGNIRVKGGGIEHPAGIGAAIQPIPAQDATMGILASLQSQGQVRAEMGGAALDMSNSNTQLSTAVGSQGVDRAYSVMEQMAALMTRNMAESLIKKTFKLIHETYRIYFFDQDISNKKRGEWLTSNPKSWPRRNRITVKVGLSAGERTRKASALRQIILDQQVFTDKGMDDILVNVEGFYKAEMDWLRVSEVENPEQYFVNPSSESAKKAMESAKLQQAAIAKQQQALTDRAIKLSEYELRLDDKHKQNDLMFKYFKEMFGGEVEEAKIVGKAATELARFEMGEMYGTSNSKKSSD